MEHTSLSLSLITAVLMPRTELESGDAGLVLVPDGAGKSWQRLLHRRGVGCGEEKGRGRVRSCVWVWRRENFVETKGGRRPVNTFADFIQRK